MIGIAIPYREIEGERVRVDTDDGKLQDAINERAIDDQVVQSRSTYLAYAGIRRHFQFDSQFLVVGGTSHCAVTYSRFNSI